ncbi:tRNA dihydrouridine synthase [Mycoemilia scoparia]|uniref:tRNA dihydrouridine synthase n=1 Tax=Mycoemilia scoparia TaxID=417184 RepID=A0A9W7ZP45_9FUNG|nr:tRNA dihydrouridine synthase [Mycoemilia scoparia]
MLADVFKESEFGRDDFTTNNTDSPVVAQFAASNPKDLADAAEIIAPYVDGVDLNCGCPQRWAWKEKIGAYMMEQPELVREMVRNVKARVDIPCSIKIRKHDDLRYVKHPVITFGLQKFVRRAESVGVDWITIHGRTRKQSNRLPVDVEAIKLVKSVATVPIIANGGVFTKEQADQLHKETGVNGIMSARGLLKNPAFFAGHDYTPLECVQVCR